MKTNAFLGVITAIVTPFTKHGTIDLDSFHELMRLQKTSGVSGVVVLGSTGEAATLTEKESDELVIAALEHQSNEFQIFVGTGTNSTATTIEKSVKYSKFKSHGKSLDGLLIVTPYYNKPQQEHLVYHYAEVCSHVQDTAVCLYNVPSRTGINIQPNTFTKIASQNKNMVAIKEAAGNINTIAEMRLSLNQANLSYVHILSGDDATFAPSLLCGSDGVISVSTNLIPKIMCDILASAHKNLWEDVKNLHLKTYHINQKIFCVTNPVGIKYLLSKTGVCQNILRPPLYSTDDHEIKILDEIFNDIKQNKIKILGE